MPVEDLQTQSSVRHKAAIYAPTGGNRVEELVLVHLQQQIRDIARQAGYPGSLDEQKRRVFDACSGQILHEQMDITPAEASSQGVWMFMGCVLLPDVVRWRFPGTSGETSIERFLGGNLGLRNTFGRVWWRAHILYQSEKEQPYELLYLLGEDELVQVMERPSLAGSPLLAKQVCRSFLDATGRHPKITRSDLLRDTMKRLRRLLSLVAFDALDSSVLAALVNEVFEESAISLSNSYVVSSSLGI